MQHEADLRREEYGETGSTLNAHRGQRRVSVCTLCTRTATALGAPGMPRVISSLGRPRDDLSRMTAYAYLPVSAPTISGLSAVDGTPPPTISRSPSTTPPSMASMPPNVWDAT
jgi:hypothetical protein